VYTECLHATHPVPASPLQPCVSYDWSMDKEGLAVLACLDQTLRVYITTKLHLY
jgi:hypothetical protein